MAEHSKLGASSYSRWSACPGSVRLSEGIESVSSVYAEEGTLAHAWAAYLLDPANNPKPKPGEVSPEMDEAVDVYFQYIKSLRLKKPAFEAVERKFALPSIHPLLFGTTDYAAYFSEFRLLEVVDYKHGAGVPVEVKSKQLPYYGLGAALELGFPIEVLKVTIIQPRCYHPDGPIRSDTMDAVDLLDFADDLKKAAYATENPKAPLNPGEHCRWCPAQGICPALKTRALEASKAGFTPVKKYNPKELSETLQKLDQIEAWAKSVRAFAYQEAISGRIPPGYKLVDKRATRRWKDSVTALLLAAELDLDENDVVEKKLKSPASVEKLVPKESHNLIQDLTVKESSGQNLVLDSDDRAAIDVTPKGFFPVAK